MKENEFKNSNKEIYNLILDLQSINEIESFALAGGTSLALRYNHRISIDIDLFSSIIIGKTGFETIQKKLKSHYQDALKFCELINTESGNQYCFLRALINKDGNDIKVEFIQNIQLVEPIELFESVKIISVKDIGIMKLLSASSRKAKKDIYDLDFITEEFELEILLNLLREKTKRYAKLEYRNLFDLDNDSSPSDNIALLLEFDNIDYSSIPKRPSHSNDRIEIVFKSKSWLAAKLSWKKKVRNLMFKNGFSFAGIKPIN
jgi:hypothetical protein